MSGLFFERQGKVVEVLKNAKNNKEEITYSVLLEKTKFNEEQLANTLKNLAGLVYESKPGVYTI